MIQVTICAPEEAEPNHVQVNDRSGGPIPADIVASLPTRFLLDIARSDGNQNLTFEIKGPDGKLRKGIIKPTKDSGTYVLTFTPDIVGVYNVQILSGETCLTNTPFKVRAIPAGDAQKCYIKDLPVIEYWPAGETKVFTVDTSEAGCGALGVLPSREQEVEYSIEPQPGTKNQLVSITPLTTGPHIVDFLFGGRNIPNGTLRFEYVSILVRNKFLSIFI
ncbi:unnamed protein product [Enterobius vermicularis]|uniref:Filamin-A n=1 Tax=Enterobius vermicularis TaxID=51028 RepID=A0A0N4UYP0_ENTVE|nr:unnamed protein product [Enterobius vermicularis]